ncbi:hypothetical protein I4U23_003248 [Adineta vaga]|nr:hypothetical protein I4U23_003248 [Adineta vaga]
MSLQSCVNRLFKLNSNYLYADQAFNQASSLQTLSDDLYSDPLRFLYELVQNADDASSTRLQFALIEGNYLIVAHNGRIFSEEDVRSLCSINKSTKTQDAQTVGYKGLGFKAIFGKSDYALIMTNNEAFRFDATHEFEWTWTDINRKKWERDNKRKFIYPWQICPIWTEHHEIPAPVLSWILTNRLSVNIIIRLLNIEETQNAFRQLADQPHTFLFLRHIRELKFSESLKSSSICIKNEPNEIIRLLYNAKQHSQWLVCRRQVLVPPEKLEDIRLPKKLRSVQSTEIILAAKISTQNEKKFIPVSNDDNILFAYIPTKISTYKLPILVNTNFLTNANREQIHTDSTWNQWLFERIPHETIEWMKDIIMKREWGSKGYELLPTAAMGNDILTKIYNDNRSHALSDAKFICNTHGEYLTVREAIIDLTGLSNQPFVDTELIRQYIIHNYNGSRIPLPTNPFVS